LLVDEIAQELVVCFLNVAESFDEEDVVLLLEAALMKASVIQLVPIVPKVIAMVGGGGVLIWIGIEK
jgi:hypothetical protein